MLAKHAALLAAALLSLSSPAYAIRPFVTDDARVVGAKFAQLETWALVDSAIFEHNLLLGIGPTPWLELTAGLVHGTAHTDGEQGYTVTGPILQGKALIVPAINNSWPGVAAAAGALAPAGHGRFTPPGWAGFAYVAATESVLEEMILLHANVGLAVGERRAGPLQVLPTAGVGFQVRIIAGLHGIGEIYYGDPYDSQFDYPAIQLGFRYIFSEHVQMDGTFGTTLEAVERQGHAHVEQWGTLGLRLVTPELW